MESAKVLLLRGIDPTIKNIKGKTAFEVFGENVNPKPTAKQKATAVSALTAAREEYQRGRLAEVESRNAVLERPARTYTSLLFSERFSEWSLSAAAMAAIASTPTATSSRRARSS